MSICKFHPEAKQYKLGKCSECHKLVKQANPDGNRYWTSKGNALKRHIEWELSFEQWKAIVSQPCVYRTPDSVNTVIGLDRIDSTLGYLETNVHPCCYKHNQAKSDIFTHDQMLDISIRYSITCGDKPMSRVKRIIHQNQ